MKFKNEYELQAFIHSRVGGQREVKFPDGSRVDILTDTHAIEVKPKLTRSALLQAAGQSAIYRMHVPNHAHVIAGMTPKNTSESYATAERVRETGIQVWYIDQMSEFTAPVETEYVDYDYEEEYSGLPGWVKALAWAAGLAFLAGMCNQQAYVPVYQTSAGTRVIDTLSPDATVSATGQCQGDYAEIRYGARNGAGWVRKTEFETDVCR